MEPPPLPIDSLRLKLVQTIDQLSTLQSSLHYNSLSLGGLEPNNLNPGISTYNELLLAFNLLLSHITGLGGILNEVNNTLEESVIGGGAAGGAGETGRDKKKERWENEVVAPKFEVEESRDWIVGMLLRTKQTPLIESHHLNLLSSLPASFLSPQTYSNSLSSHTNLTSFASTKIDSLKEGPNSGGEWDWKGRVEIDSDDEDEEEEDGMEMDVGEEGEKKVKRKAEGEGDGGRKWSINEVVEFMKSGKKPV